MTWWGDAVFDSIAADGSASFESDPPSCGFRSNRIVQNRNQPEADSDPSAVSRIHAAGGPTGLGLTPRTAGP